jgi:hypothetical protein
MKLIRIEFVKFLLFASTEAFGALPDVPVLTWCNCIECHRISQQTRHRPYLLLVHLMCKGRMLLPKVGSSLYPLARIPRNLVHGYVLPAYDS